MANKQVLKTRWYINITGDEGEVCPILVKDIDGSIKFEYSELVSETSREIKKRLAKYIVTSKGYDIEVDK